MAYLYGREHIALPAKRRSFDRSVVVKGAYKHNLKEIDVTFPLGVMAVVTGVSGSGKSTLVRDIFYQGMLCLLDAASTDTIPCREIVGNYNDVQRIEYVDQNSIGKSTRSNPVTYIGAYDDIRKLFAAQTLSKQMGYTPAFFSFNKEGGRCEFCKGEGFITVEMQFMADMEIECEECHGKRFTDEILEVEYRGLNISQVLNLTVSEAIQFFGQEIKKSVDCRRIVERLSALETVGLGYIKLGQSSSTLSGGENQRVKLATYLSAERTAPTLFIFDEPTTGLHSHDISVLLKAFDALIERGHSLVIVEHNLDVIKMADYVIDLGPEAGDRGGNLVYQGTPEGLMQVAESYTGKYLKEKVEQDAILTTKGK